MKRIYLEFISVIILARTQIYIRIFQFIYSSRNISTNYYPIQTRLPRPCVFVFAWLINVGLPRPDHTVVLRVQDTNRTRERTRGIASGRR